MMKIQLIGTAVLAGVMVVGCGKEAPQAAEPVPSAVTQADPNEIVAEVAGEKLTRGALEADVEKLVAFQLDRMPAAQQEEAKTRLDEMRKMFRMRAVQGFVASTALMAKAKKLGVQLTEADRKERVAELEKNAAGRPDAPKTFEEIAEKSPFGKERGMAEIEKTLIIEKMIKAHGDAAVRAKDFAAEAEKAVAEAAKANEAAEKKIKELKAQLSDPACTNVPAKFAELAEANSDCPSGKRDHGNLGEFGHGQMVKEFDEVAFSLPVGKVSDVVKTQFGYHLILVTKKTPAVEAKDGQPAVEEKVTASHILVSARDVGTKEDIVQMSKRRAEGEAQQEFFRKALREAGIKLADEFKDLLPPEETDAAAAEGAEEKK